LPVPLPPEVICIQGALLVAVHGHPAGKVTATIALPPMPAKVALDGVSTAGGLDAGVVDVEELSVPSGSKVVGLATEAVFTIFEPLTTEQLTRATIVMTADD
jgi:hypothetical protein